MFKKSSFSLSVAKKSYHTVESIPFSVSAVLTVSLSTTEGVSFTALLATTMEVNGDKSAPSEIKIRFFHNDLRPVRANTIDDIGRRCEFYRFHGDPCKDHLFHSNRHPKVMTRYRDHHLIHATSGSDTARGELCLLKLGTSQVLTILLWLQTRDLLFEMSYQSTDCIKRCNLVHVNYVDLSIQNLVAVDVFEILILFLQRLKDPQYFDPELESTQSENAISATLTMKGDGRLYVMNYCTK